MDPELERLFARYERELGHLRRLPMGRIVIRVPVPSDVMAFPSDQTLLISRIAVPPQDHDSDDFLALRVEEYQMFSAPVSYLIDSYTGTDKGKVGQLYQKLHELFSVMNDKVIETGCDELITELRALHGSLDPRDHRLGYPVEIVVLPRQHYQLTISRRSIEDQRELAHLYRYLQQGKPINDGTRLTVYLECFYTRDIG